MKVSAVDDTHADDKEKGIMKQFLVTMAVLGVMATPVLADPISDQRAAAIEKCSHESDAKYGPSGVRDWRRYDHNYYAACMFDQGQPE
jgi:hypothetical protein